MPPSLEAVTLTKHYGSIKALDHLDLKLSGNKCVGFLGPNGAGKTTTFKLFADMLRPTGGNAYINGTDVREDRRKALADCGLLIETPEIYPALTPREGLAMVAALRGLPEREARTRIDEAIAEVKMEEWKNQKVGKFSKGMKQRINIAAALLTDPQILILDEPTMGLDPRGMAEVRAMVKALKRRDRLVFLSSHLLDEVTAICDEIAFVDHGKLLAFDTIGQLVSRFGGGLASIELGFSRGITEELANSEIASLPGVSSMERLGESSLRVRISGGLPVQERVLADIASRKLGLVSFKPDASALEATYLQLIERGD